MNYLVTRQLRVTSIRSRGSFGGVIFVGKDEDDRLFVVRADNKLVPDPTLVERAQTWTVHGVERPVTFHHLGVERTEIEINAGDLALERPSGKNIIAWIAQSPDCRGIGDVRARRLYERFGAELLPLIEASDIGRLSEVIDVAAAEALVEAFAKHAIAPTLVWLDQLTIPKAIATSVVRYWHSEARAKVDADPYALISFCANWKTVDALALSRFKLERDDSRRLIAAVEQALYDGMDRGSTALQASDLAGRLRLTLGDDSLSARAIAAAIDAKRVVANGELIQTTGLAYVENSIAQSLASRLTGASERQEELFQVDRPDVDVVDRLLLQYESMLGVELAPEQRVAVRTSSTQTVSLILGGAGTGKTTALKALCHVLERTSPEAEIHQFALAGRAAQRMSQATGRPSKTIAAFLKDPQVAAGATVLVDEMSMVDALLMYRLLKALPGGVRLVLIGDPSQLPPIGPGLVLHALEGLAGIPQIKLSTVKRQTSASGIPQVAAAIRAHVPPDFSQYEGLAQGVSVVECSESQLDDAVAGVYAELGGCASDFSVQVVGVTRNGAGGVKRLNALIHDRFAPKLEPIKRTHPEFGTIYERTDDGLTLHAEDLVIFGANDYRLGLRNGSLGKILGASTSSGESAGLVRAEFDGIEFELTDTQLAHVVHAYCFTTHRAQGSQFERVIIPIRSSKLLDNALLYTAITRGVSQVVLVGNIKAAMRAIQAPSSASRRVTGLMHALQRQGLTVGPAEL